MVTAGLAGTLLDIEGTTHVITLAWLLPQNNTQLLLSGQVLRILKLGHQRCWSCLVEGEDQALLYVRRQEA
jgi:hypothetical protein